MSAFGGSSFNSGDVVTAIRDLGNRVWRSGIARGTIGVVVDVDWLGDPRVAFTVDGDLLGGNETVEKTVTDSDIRRVPRA